MKCTRADHVGGLRPAHLAAARQRRRDDDLPDGERRGHPGAAESEVWTVDGREALGRGRDISVPPPEGHV